MKKNIINIAFILGIFLFLTAGLLKTIFYPKDINYYENRKAEKLANPTIDAFLEGNLQDNVAASITDQAFFSGRMKKTYNNIKSNYMRVAISAIAENNPQKYIRVGTYYLFDKDNLIFPPYGLSYAADEIESRCNNFNTLFEKYPQTDFYMYYIEKDTDVVFTDNTKIGAFELFKEKIQIPNDKFIRYEIKNFDEFDKYFFKTDHHWNHEGSYRGYREVVKFLNPDENVFIEPEDTVVISDSFKGSKTLTEETSLYKEKFLAYKFNYPQMNITVNGVPGSQYGNEAEFFAGTGRELTYGEFYGGDFGEVIFETGQSDKENVLIVGESFDNAILKLVASHFNKTVSIDMRYYKAYMGMEFSFEECLKVNEIDKVLFIGNIDYFVSPEFEVEK